MFPLLSVGGTEISMTGMGIVLGYIVFLVSMFFYCKHNNLSFLSFFLSQPVLIILMYLGGRGVTVGFDIITQSHIHFSLQGSALLSFFLPKNFAFHYIGVILGMVVYFRLFLSKKIILYNRIKRIDGICRSLCLAFIPLGVFFLLGDDIIGKPTSSSIGVKALSMESELMKYNKVYPFGLGISLIGIVGFFLLNFLNKKTRQKNGYIVLASIFLLLSLLLLYQKYPRRGVMELLNATVDVKQYFSRMLVVLFLLLHIFANAKIDTYVKTMFQKKS